MPREPDEQAEPDSPPEWTPPNDPAREEERFRRRRPAKEKRRLIPLLSRKAKRRPGFSAKRARRSHGHGVLPPHQWPPKRPGASFGVELWSPPETRLDLQETRLDVLVFRCGFAQDIRQARAVVMGRYVEVDGKVEVVPSYRVEPGQVIQVSDRSQRIPLFRIAAAGGFLTPRSKVPAYLDVDLGKLRAVLVRRPRRTEIPDRSFLRKALPIATSAPKAAPTIVRRELNADRPDLTGSAKANRRER